MNKTSDKLILFCIWLSLLICVNYLWSLSQSIYRGPYALSPNYLNFSIDVDKKDSLYSQLDGIKGAKIILSFDDDLLYIKASQMFIYNVEVIQGFDISDMDYYKENKATIINERYSHGNSNEITTNTELTIVGVFKGMAEDIDGFKAITTLTKDVGLSTNNYMDFSYKWQKEQAMEILDNLDVEFQTAVIPFTLMFEMMNYLNPWQKNLFFALFSFLVMYQLIDYLNVNRQKKEFLYLLKKGISKRSIAFNVIKKYVLNSLLMMALAFVCYYTFINQFIESSGTILICGCLSLILLMIQVFIYRCYLGYAWRKER